MSIARVTLTIGNLDHEAAHALAEQIENDFRLDPLAVTIVEEASTRLGLKVAYLTNFFNPEVVVLGGGLERGGELVLNTVRRVVKQLAMEEASGIAKIILSRLGEDAVAYGAVCLVTQELFAEV